MITSFSVLRVIGSKDRKHYTEGDLVLVPAAPVAEYSIIPSSEILRKIDAQSGISLPEYIGSLGWFYLESFYIYIRFLLNILHFTYTYVCDWYRCLIGT